MSSWLLSVLFTLWILYIYTNSETITCPNGTNRCDCDPIESGECILNCIGTNSCKDDVITCRDGDKCTINCNGNRACRGAHITCGANNDCTLNCINGNNVCVDSSRSTFIVNINNANNYQCIGSLCPPTATPTNLPTKIPSYFPSNNPSISPSMIPTYSPSTYNPTKSPSLIPTYSPSTLQPTTDTPTISPSDNPSISPSTSSPTRYPTYNPTKSPSLIPTYSPSTSSPTLYPTYNPTKSPSLIPTHSPSTLQPTTDIPTASPSDNPSISPSMIPTYSPSTSQPTVYPTYNPTKSPSLLPTYLPSTLQPTTDIPTISPSDNPSISPFTTSPTIYPTYDPSQSPSKSSTNNPSIMPTNSPSTLQPTIYPTYVPSKIPTTYSPSTLQPTTDNPSISPSTSSPTVYPIHNPTKSPSMIPTYSPSTSQQTLYPTYNPTKSPSDNPSISPSTTSPTIYPTYNPIKLPSLIPTYSPSSLQPTIYPTHVPSMIPTAHSSSTLQPSSNNPSISPSTAQPTTTIYPTYNPSKIPSKSPTIKNPTNIPTYIPSMAPSTISPSNNILSIAPITSTPILPTTYTSTTSTSTISTAKYTSITPTVTPTSNPTLNRLRTTLTPSTILWNQVHKNNKNPNTSAPIGRCTTTSFTPTWVTVGMISCTFLMLIITSIYSIKWLKRSSRPLVENESELELERVDSVPSLSRIGSSDESKIKTEWDEATCFGKFKLWMEDMWLRQAVYVPLVAHLSDTATDFAAVVEFYDIASTNDPKQCGGLNVWYLFAVSLCCMIVYRIISSITIWRITKSMKRVILQFLDIELFEVLYLSHRLRLKSASSPQRLISTLEAVFESAPQSVIQMVYLMKTGNLSGVIFISTILSFMNLTMTILEDDKVFLDATFAVPWIDNKYDDDGVITEDSGCYKFGKYVCLYLFRICDIPSQLLQYVFIWYFVSGYALSIIVSIDIIVALSTFAQSKNTDALLSIIAIPFSFKKGRNNHWDLLNGFWCYSFCRFLAGNGLIWIYISWIREEDEYIQQFEQSTFVGVLWLFCFMASVMKLFFCGLLFKLYDVDMYFDESKERSDIEGLLDDQAYDDVIELIFYCDSNLYHNAEQIYESKTGDCYSLLSIAAGCSDNIQLFQSILDNGLDQYFKEHYYTALMVAARDGHKQYIDLLMNNMRMSYDYVKRQDVSLNTALYYAIKHAHDTNYEDDILEIFLKHLDRLFDKEQDGNKKKFDFLNAVTSMNGEDETALHLACFLKVPLILFQDLYEFYPKSYGRIALQRKNAEGETVLDLCSRHHNDDVTRFILSKLSNTNFVSQQIDISMTQSSYNLN